jgi:hypothetical protein
MQDKSIINWKLHQKLMAKKRTIKVCTGVGLNMFFPEYVTIELQDIDTEIKKNTIITDWLEEHGDPEIETKVKKQLRKSKKNG